MRLAVVGAFALVAACKSGGGSSPDNKQAIEVTTILEKKLAFEAYPQWAMAHPEKECPDSIADLLQFIPEGAVDKDVWGHPLQMTCGATNPPGAKGVAIRSFGPDGIANNADDIKSW